jgi:hypothetical protein
LIIAEPFWRMYEPQFTMLDLGQLANTARIPPNVQNADYGRFASSLKDLDLSKEISRLGMRINH